MGHYSGHSSGFEQMQESFYNPTKIITNSIEKSDEADSQAEEEVDSTAQANQGSALKHELSALAPDKRRSQDAYIAIFKQTHKKSGGKVKVSNEPVTVGDGGRELREYRFIITSANYPNAERFMVRSTFGDGPEVAHSFGEQPRMWQFKGILRRGTPPEGGGDNPTGAGDYTNNWWQALEEMYRTRLRASLLMKNNEFIRFRIGKLSIRGYITQFNTTQSERADDASAQFAFSMYVRSYNFADDYEYIPASEKLAADAPIFTEGATGDVSQGRSQLSDIEAVSVVPVETGDIGDLDLSSTIN